MIGHLHMLWWWALDYAPDGDLAGYDAADVADAADWPGDPETFTGALLACGRGGRHGFIEKGPDGQLMIHDWMEYAGKLVKRREADAARKRSERQAASTDCDVQGMSDGCPTDGARTNQPTNQPTEQTEPTNLSSAAPATETPSCVVPITQASQTSKDVAEVWAYYRERIQPKARICPESKIRTRLKRFKVPELKDAMDRFKANWWWMSHCAKQGGEWFFETDQQIDRFLLIEPETQEGYEARHSRPTPSNGRAEAAPPYVPRKTAAVYTGRATP